MSAQTTQIRVTIPSKLHTFLQIKAGSYGLNMSSYVLHLILKNAEESEFPTFSMSEKTEKVLLHARQDHAAGKTHEMRDIDDFLKSL